MLLYLPLASHHGYSTVSEDKAEAELQESAKCISELDTKIICWQWVIEACLVNVSALSD
jgi:hypothetical protein